MKTKQESPRIHTWGDGFFTTLLRWDGKWIGVDFHFKRLKQSADIFKLDFPFHNKEEFIFFLNQSEIPPTTISRVTFSAIETNKSYLRKNPDIKISLEHRDFPTDLEVNRINGVSLSLSQLNYQAPLHQSQVIKWNSYQPWAIIRNTNPDGYDTIIQNHGKLLETTTGSLMVKLKDGNLISPSGLDGSLQSTTLKSFIKFAKKHSLPFNQEPILWEELFLFDSVYFLNAVVGMIPVREITEKNKVTNFSLDSELCSQFWKFYIS